MTAIETQALFDNDDTVEDSLKINKSYEKRFNLRKDKEELTKLSSNAKHVSEDVSSSDEEDEDSDAELLTKEVHAKILTTICRIKAKDPSIYDKNKQFFDDNDFQINESSSKSKPLTFTKFMTHTLKQEGPEAFVREEDRIQQETLKDSNIISYNEEQQALKHAFIAAAENSGDDGNDDFLEKTDDKLIENTSFQHYLQARSHKGPENEKHLLDRYFQNEETLAKEDIFLRNYVLFEGWKEGNKMPQGGPIELENRHQLEEIDDSVFDEAATFEAAYNFRYEESAAPVIEGHARRVLDSVRQKEEKRKKKRLERKEMKLQKKEKEKRELERLQVLKRKEILDRLKTIQRIAGVETSIDPMSIDFDADFDQETHEKYMKEILGDDFDQQDEPNVETIEDMPKELAECVPDVVPPILQTAPISAKQRKKLEKIAKKKAKMAQEDDGEAYAPINLTDNVSFTEQSTDFNNTAATEDNEFIDAEDIEGNHIPLTDDSGNQLWFICDNCNFGISAGKKRYECPKCDDFVLCVNCFRSVRHPHRLIRRRIPDGCNPPEEFTKHHLQTNKQENTNESTEQTTMVQDALESYYGLQYEDLIGGMPVRFKYTPVQKDTFGFTVDDILNRTDAELNSIVSLKKLAPYGKSLSKRQSARYFQTRKKLKELLPTSNEHDRLPTSTTNKHNTTMRRKTDVSYSQRKKRIVPNHVTFPDQPKKVKKLNTLRTPAPEGISESRLQAYGLQNV